MIFPAITETLVLPFDREEVERRIRTGLEQEKFVGVIKNDQFALSARLLRPPQFHPVVYGRIESSSRGSMIFLKFALQPGTRVILGFSFVILIILAIQVAFVAEKKFYAVLLIGVIFIFRMVASSNLRIHKDTVRNTLLGILS